MDIRLGPLGLYCEAFGFWGGVLCSCAGSSAQEVGGGESEAAFELESCGGDEDADEADGSAGIVSEDLEADVEFAAQVILEGWEVRADFGDEFIGRDQGAELLGGFRFCERAECWAALWCHGCDFSPSLALAGANTLVDLSTTYRPGAIRVAPGTRFATSVVSTCGTEARVLIAW